MKNKTLFIFGILLLLSSFSVFAGSISISSVTIPSSTSQGDSFSLVAYVSGSEATSVQASLTLPSGLSCTPSTAQSISLDGSGAGSATWTCSADIAGSYTSGITVSVSATDSSSGGSLTASTQTGLQVLSPASLTTDSSLASSSITTSGSTTFTVTLNNVGDSSTTYSISIASSPSGVTSTLATGSASGTITGSSLVTNTYTVSSSTATTYTLTATITGGNAQTLTASKNLTITAVSSSSSSSSSSGSSSTTIVTPEVIVPKSTTTLDKVASGSQALFAFDTTGLKISEIKFTSNKDLTKIGLTLTEIARGDIASELSLALKTPAGRVYTYFNIQKTNFNDADIQGTAAIKFKINKVWLTDNHVDKSELALFRYVGNQWVALPTTYLSDDSTSLFYRAETPGFSYFSVAQRKPIEQNQVTVLNNTVPQTVNNQSTTSSLDKTSSSKKRSSSFWLLLVLGILILSIVLYFIIDKRRKQRPYHF